MSNPYLAKGRGSKQSYFNVKAQAPVSDNSQFRGRGTEGLVGRNGEINASNKLDLMKQIATLIENSNNGNIRKGIAASTEVIAERKKLVEAAMNDKNGEAWQVLGMRYAA